MLVKAFTVRQMSLKSDTGSLCIWSHRFQTKTSMQSLLVESAIQP